MKIETSPGRWTALAFALLLAGCASYKGIEPASTLRTPESVGVTATGVASTVNAQWWRSFGDEQLDRLVAQALEGNPNLKIAQARLAKARAVLEVANSAMLPQVNGSLEITRQRYTENGLFPPPIAGSIRDNATLQLGTSWEIDFFGKYKQALEAALGTARAAEADVAAARVLLASNVARSYFQLSRIHGQLDVARRTLAQREQSLSLVRDRVNAGLDTALELKQAEGALPEARQQIEALQEQSDLTQHALGALVGQPQAVAQARPITQIKQQPITGAIPADLLARRADINAARLRVEAATHDIASAKAQFYPNINLAGFIGLSSLGVGKLLDTGSLQWGVGPAIHLPIFDAGRLRANLRGKTADLDIAVETYNNTLIDAVKDVADQVATARSVERQIAEQKQAEASAEGAFDIAVRRYKAGLGTYLNVLSAETAVLNQRRLGVELAGRALDTQVQLMRALGGGYSVDAAAAQADTKEPAQVTAQQTTNGKEIK